MKNSEYILEDMRHSKILTAFSSCRNEELIILTVQASDFGIENCIGFAGIFHRL